MRLFTDLPIESEADDQYGLQAYAETLRDMIESLEPGQLPLCIGVYGEWGSGKTSLMNLTHKALPSTTKSIWFNPWKYDRKEVLWHALLVELISDMEESAPRDVTFHTAKERVYGLLGAFVRGGIQSIAEVAQLGPLAEALLEEGGAGDGIKRIKALRSSAHEFEEAFRDLVAAYVGPDGRLVVFIDDLDRCLPENSITVLEAIKLFLDRSRCVFIIGADQNVIQHGIAKLYGADYASRDYLEKIIQLHVRMPRVLSQATDELWQQVKDQVEFKPFVKDMVTAVFGHNQRQWKRFMNTYAIASAIARRRGVDKDSDESWLAASGATYLLWCRNRDSQPVADWV